MMAFNPWRAGIAVAAIVAVLLIGMTVARWHQAAGQLTELRHQLQAEQSARAREIQVAAQASKEYQDELETLRLDRRPAPVVRLCRPAMPADAVAVPAARSDETGTPARMGLSGATGGDRAGPDVGPDLDAIAARCDALTAQLRALQGWVGASAQ